MHHLTDHELISKIQEGNHLAFSALVERHSEMFYRLAYRYLLDQQQAEDVVQDAFIKLWTHPQLWDKHRQNNFTTWFCRIIINRCLDCKKAKQCLPIGEEVEDESPDQEQKLIYQEAQRWVEEEINRLPERQRTAIILCFFEDLSNQEAAEIMGVTLKALQSLIMRAKTSLKNKIQTY